MIKLPHADELQPPVEPDTSRRADVALRDVLSLLRARTGHDFAQYKRATVLRRIERRLQVNQLRDLPTYRDFLRDNPAETRPLLKDMLISVTNFFRDREAFEALERNRDPGPVRRQVHRRPGPRLGGRLRDGRGGLFDRDAAAEYANELAAPPGLQVFATDIDEDAIAFGTRRHLSGGDRDRRSAGAAAPFLHEGAGRLPRAEAAARDGDVRAAQRAQDPPFSRLDLVSAATC